MKLISPRTFFIVIFFTPLISLQAQNITYSKPFDLVDQATLDYVDSIDIFSQVPNPRDIAFSADGTKLFILALEYSGVFMGKIYQYSVADPFDISSEVSYDVQYDFSTEETEPGGMVFNHDGTKMYVVGNQSTSFEIHQYSLTNPFDISSGVSNDGTENIPGGTVNDLVFSPDGSKVFALSGQNSDRVYQYSITNPYDVTSGLSLDDYFSIGGEIPTSYGIYMSTDGTTMMVGGDGIFHYSLTNPFDITSNVTYEGKSEVSNFSPGSSPQGFVFSGDGTKVFAVSSSTVDAEVNQYSIPVLDFSESVNNDGSVENRAFISLNGDMFTNAGGTLATPGNYAIGGIPSGLSPILTIDPSGLFATFTLSGNAVGHEDANDVGDLVFTFENSAFTGGDASSITNAVSASSSFKINFEDNNSPVITTTDQVSFLENQTGTVLDIDANNGDGGATDVAITYSITGGADQADFTIDASTGVLTFQSPPDFDIPGDMNGDNIYTVEITADDEGATNNTTAITISVMVTNEYEEPFFTSTSDTTTTENNRFELDVNALVGVGEADVDLTYTVNGTDASAFKIDQDNGLLEFMMVPDYENPTDSDADNEYLIQVTADDGTNSTDQMITIQVTDVDEPTFPGFFDLESVNGNNGVVLYNFYKPLPAGDINGDGIGDILVENRVVFGSRTGLPDTLMRDDLNGKNGFELIHDYPVITLTRPVGDVNADGFDDMYVGFSENYNTPIYHYIVYGKSEFSAEVDVRGNSFGEEDGFQLINNYLGIKEVEGAFDVNGDDIDDFMFFATDDRVYIIFGKDGNFGENFSFVDLDASNGFYIEDPGSDQGFGSSFSSLKDINDDDIDDFIIDVPGPDTYYVVFGSDSGFGSSFDLSTLDGTNGFTINGFSATCCSFSSKSGDVNSDGINDILISHGQRGEAYVIFGKSTYAGSLDLMSLDGTNGFIIEGIEDVIFPHFSIGNINGDEFPDLVLENVGISSEGYVLFGQETGIASPFEIASLNGNNGFTIKGTDSSEDAMNIGDINGDGIDDIAVHTRPELTEIIIIIYGLSKDPLLRSITPTREVDDLSNDLELMATFSETITSDEGNITIRRSSDDTVLETIDITSPQVTFSDSLVTIIPTSGFSIGEEVYVQIDATAIIDLDGNHFSGINDKNYWNFVPGIDETAPVAILYSGTMELHLDENGNAELTRNDIDSASYDETSLAENLVFEISNPIFDCSDIGDQQVNLTVTDEAGNMTNVVASIEVIDNLPPTVLGKDTTLTLVENETVELTPDDLDDGSSDNCGFELSLSQTSFTGADAGVVLVDLTATDESGNTTISSVTVVVQRAPQIEDQSFNVDENSSSGFVFGTVIATDEDGDELAFSILSGNIDNAFAIHQTTGEITVDNPDAQDFEVTPSFTLIVEVDDGNGGIASASILINLNDLDDIPLALSSGNGIEIYPNPVNEVLTIRGLKNRKDLLVILSDVSGKVLIEKKYSTESGELDVSAFKSGIYILSIESNGQIFKQRIIKN